jgi:hypothetical protein
LPELNNYFINVSTTGEFPGSFTFYKQNVNNPNDLESIYFERNPIVSKREGMRDLWPILRRDIVATPSWILSKPETALKKYNKYGPRALLYIVLNCTTVKGPYLSAKRTNFENYKNDIELLWRDRVGAGGEI